MQFVSVKSGIRKRIIRSMLIISIMPLIAGLYLTYLDVSGALRNSIGESFQEEANEIARKIEMVIKGETVEVQRLTASADVRDAIKNTSRGRNELNNYIRDHERLAAPIPS